MANPSNPFSIYENQPFSFGAPTDFKPFAFGAPSPTPKPPIIPPTSNAPAAAPGFDMGAFLKWLQSQSQPAPAAPLDFGAQVAGIRSAKDPQGAANRGYQPGVNNAYNPFSNGFFNS